MKTSPHIVDYLANPDFNSWQIWLFIIGTLVVVALIQRVKYFQRFYWLITTAAIIISCAIGYLAFKNIPITFIVIAASMIDSCLGRWSKELQKP